jgi:hypothetical protein
METWHILLIIAAIVIILYLVMRKQVLPAAPIPVAVPNPPAPGVTPTTGEVYNNPPPPPPSNTTGVGGTIRSAVMVARPSNVLQHVPVVGEALALPGRVTNRVVGATTNVANRVNSSIEHIPVAGKALAAPGKAVSSAIKSISSWL